MSMDGPFPPRASESSFFRRPSLRRKGSRKSTGRRSTTTTTGGEDGANRLVDLEGGLAITLNLEVSPRDPAGITSPYKLLVPMLRYDGTDYEPPATKVAKGWRKWLGVGRREDTAGAEGAHPPAPHAPPAPAPHASESDRDDAPASEDDDSKPRRRRWFGL